MKTAAKVILVILSLLIVAGFITAAVKTDFFRDLGGIELPSPGIPGDDEEEAEPYLEIAGEKYTSETVLAADSELRVDVKNLENYTVDIVASDRAFFDFLADDNLYRFPYKIDGDWNKAFNLQVYDGYFTFNNQDLVMNHILLKALNANEVPHVSALSDTVSYFNIKVSNNETTFVIPLKGFGGIALEEEELMIFISQTEIVF